MLKFTKNIFLIGLVVALGFYFRDELGQFKNQIQARYFPCKEPISYSLNSYDPKFGISEEYFVEALKDAEQIWENPSGLDLFVLKEEGQVKVNLIYDARQATTEKLKELDVVVENNRASYDSVKAMYDNLVSEYEKIEAEFDARVSNFETRKAQYEAEVRAINKKGGASKTESEKLNIEKGYLSREIASIEKIQAELNSKIAGVNALASSLNDLAKKLNINVDTFNSIGDDLGSEFEEGTYIQDATGQRIEIYQFDNRTKLVRVLAHELGHALGLDHVDDAKAIMYYLNNGVSEALSEGDIIALKVHCGIN